MKRKRKTAEINTISTYGASHRLTIWKDVDRDVLQFFFELDRKYLGLAHPLLF